MSEILNKLREDIHFIEGMNSCMNCGVCTAICPAAEFYNYDPRVIVETVQRGNEEEIEEWHHLYPEFAKVAEEEGFKDISVMYRMIIEAEKNHETRYRKLLSNLQENLVFERPQTVRWYCRKCGYIHEGPTAPKVCPACLHPQAFFELFQELY